MQKVCLLRLGEMCGPLLPAFFGSGFILLWLKVPNTFYDCDLAKFKHLNRNLPVTLKFRHIRSIAQRAQLTFCILKVIFRHNFIEICTEMHA